MYRTILVTSGKGGTGKSTVCVMLGRALAEIGRRVLIIELDSGLRGLDIMLGVQDRVVFDISDVLMGRCKPAKAIVPVPMPGNLHFIAAPMDRFFIADSDNLVRLVSGFLGYYDHLIIDSGAGMGSGLEVCLRVTETALVVVNADPICVRDAQRLVGVLDAGGVRKIRLVINRFERKQMTGTLPDIDAVIDQMGARLIAIVPEDEEVAVACGMGLSLSQKSMAGRAFQNLAGRISGRHIKIDADVFR